VTELLLVGISHRIAPVALRERVALTERQAARFLTTLCVEPALSEAVAISTCNRTELYVVLEEASAAAAGPTPRSASTSSPRRPTRCATATQLGICSV